MLKTCTKCKIEKDTSLFYKKGNGVQSWCKECSDKRHKVYYENNLDRYSEKRTRRRREISSWFKEVKAELKCSRCGEDHIATLQFHHTDPSIKEGAISLLIQRGFSKEKILNEISKCIVLCANCHFKEHYNE